MTINYDALIRHLQGHATEGPVGLLSQQSSPSAGLLYHAAGIRLGALFSAEHGWFGLAAPGEKVGDDARHPYWGVPVHSLYGAHRRPSPEMLSGLGRIVIDLQDLGVRCYTYLATLKNMLEAAGEAGFPVTVLDRPIPLGGLLDGPCLDTGLASFVAPINVPLCHGMTPGECAQYIVREGHLTTDVTVIRVKDWHHGMREPWVNFMPPSPGISNWDAAAMYSALVFTEAYPALDCDRTGPLSFRIFGAPWLDVAGLLDDLADVLPACGLGACPHRYQPKTGRYAGMVLDGILLSIANPEAFYPVTAGTIILAAVMGRHAKELAEKANPTWLDRLFGTTRVREALSGDALGALFQDWIAAQDDYQTRRVNLY